ncbi:MAG: hypothetical protein Q4G48_07350 [Bacteroidia bacterium]|nr:hypothetical protein [Bacteroidia bacterium]
MASLRFKQEDYPAVADFMINSFERDLADFTSKYRTMNSDYLAGFKESNAAVKIALSGVLTKERQKKMTSDLYAAADRLKDDVILLKDYALRGGLNGNAIGNAIKQLTGRNVEAAVKTVRDALPYYTEHAEALADMPEGFLGQMATDVAHLETLNAEQNRLMNERKQGTADNKLLYKALNKYLSEVGKAGKIIYKGTPKRDEYTISKIVSRVRAANKSGAEAPREEG